MRKSFRGRRTRPGCRRGRVDAAVLAEEFPWAAESEKAGARFLSVGTNPMMRGFDALIESLGYAYPANRFLLK